MNKWLIMAVAYMAIGFLGTAWASDIEKKIIFAALFNFGVTWAVGINLENQIKKIKK